MKLIDKSALVAEIERRRNLVEERLYINSYGKDKALYDAYKSLLSFIDTLEMKEVDLEKELIEWHKKHFQKSGTFIGMSGFYLTNSSQMELAKHFFELGLKIQNMITPLQQQRISVMKMEFWTGLQTFNESEMTLSDAYNKGIEDILEELGLRAQKGEL